MVRSSSVELSEVLAVRSSRSSWIRLRVTSGRSWSIAASTLATTVWVRRLTPCLFCSSSAADSRWIVTIVDNPKPMIMTATISRVILIASRDRNMGLAADRGVRVQQREDLVPAFRGHHENHSVGAGALEVIDGSPVGLDAEDAHRERFRVAPGLRRRLAQHGNLGHDPRGPEADRHPAVAELDDPVESRGAVAAHEDRRGW